MISNIQNKIVNLFLISSDKVPENLTVSRGIREDCSNKDIGSP